MKTIEVSRAEIETGEMKDVSLKAAVEGIIHDGVVLIPQAGASRDQQVAQTIQSRLPTSGAEYETTDPENRTAGWSITWEIYILFHRTVA